MSSNSVTDSVSNNKTEAVEERQLLLALCSWLSPSCVYTVYTGTCAETCTHFKRTTTALRGAL